MLNSRNVSLWLRPVLWSRSIFGPASDGKISAPGPTIKYEVIKSKKSVAELFQTLNSPHSLTINPVPLLELITGIFKKKN